MKSNCNPSLRRAQKLWMPRFWHRLWLPDAGTMAGDAPGTVPSARFSSSRISGLCNTISTCVPDFDIHIGATGKERHKANGSESCAKSRQAPGQRMA